MKTLTNSIFEGGPTDAALDLLKRFSDKSKSLTLREAIAGSGMSWPSAKKALEVLVEYRGSCALLTAEPYQNAEPEGDGTAYSITPFAKEYLAWKEKEMEVGVFARLHA